MRYLAVEDVIRINQSVLKTQSLIRDRNMLEAAVHRPRQSLFGNDAYPTLTEKAAALLHSLILNHPFVDGNKRTATVALILFLQLNGRVPSWNPAEALAFIIEVAQGFHKPVEIARWLDANTRPQGELFSSRTHKPLVRSRGFSLPVVPGRYKMLPVSCAPAHMPKAAGRRRFEGLSMRYVAVIVAVLLLAGCSPQDAQPTSVAAVFAPNRILAFWEPVRERADGAFAGQPWQFVGQQGDQIHLQLAGSSAGLTLSLEAPDGSIIDRGNDIRAMLPAAGIYTAVVRFAPGESADYTLELRHTDRFDPAQPTPEPSLTPTPTISPTPTTTPTPTPVFAPLGKLVGRIVNGSPANGTFEGEADDHIYLFDGLGGQYANIQMARMTGPVDPFVTLYDPQGNPLASDDNSGEGNTAQLRNILLPTSGEYILRASGAGAEGEYRLSVLLSIDRQPVTPNIPPPTATATPTPTAEPRADRLLDHVPVSGQIARPGDFARYPIIALEGEVLTIGVSPVGGSGLRPQLELYSPSGELVRQANVALSNAGGDALIPIYQAAEAGTYVSLVLGENGTNGEFVISYGLGPSRENILRGPAFADQVVTGDVTRRGLRDVWTVYLNAGDVIAATANPQSSLFNPLLELAAPDGSVIARDDNGGGGVVPLIAGVRAPATGAYLLRVMGANAASSGAYTLVWRYVAAAPTATPPAATVLLMSIAAHVPERTYLDYPFQGQAGQRVLIRVIAGPDSDLDPVVALLSADGTTLARADDNGDDLNPLLEFVLPATGTYFARVDGYQSSGQFELTVEALY